MKTIIMRYLYFCMGVMMIIGLICLAQDRMPYTWEPPAKSPGREELRVAAGMSFAPLSFHDENGNIAGHDVELIYCIGELMGVNMDVSLLPWDEAVSGFMGGEYDLLVGASNLPQDSGWVRLSKPYLNDPCSLFGSVERDFIITDLNASRLAYLESHGGIREIMGSSEPVLVPYQTYAECIAAMVSGECEFAIAPSSVGRLQLKQLGTDDFEIKNVSIHNNYYCIGVQPEDAALYEHVQWALERLSGDGTLARIYDDWLVRYGGNNNLSVMIAREPALFVLLMVAGALVFAAYALYIEFGNNSRLREMAAKLRREQGMYRDAMIKDADYCYVVNVDSDKVEAMYKNETVGSYLMDTETGYDDAIRRIVEEQLKPQILGEEQEPLYSGAQFRAAYDAGKRFVEVEFYIPGLDVYKRQVVFFYKDEEDSALYACVIVADTTNERKKELENARSLKQLVNTAKKLGEGSFDEPIAIGEHAGDFRILADVMEGMREQLRIYVDAIRAEALIDPLTGLKNKRAWQNAKERLNRELAAGNTGFAIAVCDLNELKRINDTRGHDVGDEYIIRGSRAICGAFKRSPVFRIGGDEFVVLLENEDLKNCDALLDQLARDCKAAGCGSERVSIAVGVGRPQPGDACVKEAFERADAQMYSNKALMKQRRAEG